MAMPKINPVVIGVVFAGGLGIALLVSKKPKLAISPSELDAASADAANAVAEAQAKKEAAAKAAEQAAIAKKADAVVTNKAPEKMAATPINGHLHLGITLKDGVSTDDVTTAIDKLSSTKFGLQDVIAKPGAISYTRSGNGRNLITKSWEIQALPTQVPLVVAAVHHALDPMGYTKPSVAFASATLNAAA